MSIALLKRLCRNPKGGFAEFINQFEGKSEPRIAWYPSAGNDYRALMYLSKAFSQFNPVQVEEPEPPDLFLYTDFIGDDKLGSFGQQVLYQDHHTLVMRDTVELVSHIPVPANQNLIDGSTSHDLAGNVYFVTITVDSDRLGIFKTQLLYCFAENTFILKRYLLPLQAHISHLIHVRYGGGLGGSRASGVWLKRALGLLHAEVFIHDGTDHWQDGDHYALQFCPILAEQPEPTLTPFRTIDSAMWSLHGDVTWNLI